VWKHAKIAIIAGICVAVIIGGLALFVHFRLSDVERNETRQESAEQVANEALKVISGKEPHPEGEESHPGSAELYPEKNESKEQHERESP
jgi:hypothetical protein